MPERRLVEPPGTETGRVDRRIGAVIERLGDGNANRSERFLERLIAEMRKGRSDRPPTLVHGS
jgi:hypothetical protein